MIEIKAPSPGESITEVEIAGWLVENGEYIEKDQEIAEVESDKATLPLVAEAAGKIEIIAEAGVPIKVGKVLAKIDTSVRKAEESKSERAEEPQRSGTTAKRKDSEAEPSSAKASEGTAGSGGREKTSDKIKISPVAKKMMEEDGFSVEDIIKGLKRITSREVEAVKNFKPGQQPAVQQTEEGTRDEEVKRLSTLRRKLAQRLVAVKQETAMLTTFNEADMSAVMALRKKYQEKFMKKHEVKLGFMSFFVKAVVSALKEFPDVNSRIEGNDLVTPRYYDIGIAVQTDKGLMVPIIRNAETLSLAGLEKEILTLANKARAARISIEEMRGGTFTITNGGVFGSMMSTPILNPPQAAILGMHNIVERPAAIDGQVQIRPLMYLALSYDHRIIDGRGSVSFLVRIKEYIENPAQMMYPGMDAEKALLEL